MTLQGKFKDDFFEWFKLKYLKGSHTFIIFEDLPQSAQFGLIQEFADTKGCEITIYSHCNTLGKRRKWELYFGDVRNGYRANTRQQMEEYAIDEFEKLYNQKQ